MCKNFSAESYSRARSGHIQDRRKSVISKFLGSLEKGSLVADLGCGTGGLLHDFSVKFGGLIFVGIDSKREFIEYAKRKYSKENLSFEQGDIEKFGYKDSFNFVFSIDLLHHLKDILVGIKNIHSGMKHGSVWLCMEPNSGNPYIFIGQFLKEGEKQFNQDITEKIFRKVGFKIENKIYFLAIPGKVRKPPVFIQHIEKKIEGFPFIGGSVVYELRKI